MKHVPDWRLYLVTDRGLARGRPIAGVVEAAVRGGATAVQLREKSCGTRDFVQLGRELKKLLAPFGVPLIINDRVDIALEIGADGVHIGQQDMDYEGARRLLGPGAIIGLSIETIEQARAAVPLDVDYLGAGPIFATSSKGDAGGPIGGNGVRGVVEATTLPVAAIGGIALASLPRVRETGATMAAVISALSGAADPEATARAFVTAWNKP